MSKFQVALKEMVGLVMPTKLKQGDSITAVLFGAVFPLVGPVNIIRVPFNAPVTPSNLLVDPIIQVVGEPPFTGPTFHKLTVSLASKVLV
ncbi:MAG: hypothetical protein DDT31_01840 [Syntrophomonadaceae bacterium]|nr:hypothetical protein [Bacillota bacterium]